MFKLIAQGTRYARRLPASGHKVVFTHVPKCGGMSVSSAVSGTFQPFSRKLLEYGSARNAAHLLGNPISSKIPLTDDLHYLQFLLGFHLSCGYRFVGGHYPVSKPILEQFAREYDFITVLRDPVSRWKSHYIFQKSLEPFIRETLPNKYFEGSLDNEFEKVVSSGFGLLMGSMMTSMFTAELPQCQSQAEDLVQPALENLSHYSLVGLMENMEDFSTNYKKLTGKRIRVRHEHKTRDRYSSIDKLQQLAEFLNREETNSTITELCKADLHLYSQYAR